MEIDLGFWMMGLGLVAVGMRPYFKRKLQQSGGEEIDDKVRMFGLFVGGWTLIGVGMLRLLFIYFIR